MTALLQAASTTWVAEFLRLENQTFRIGGRERNIKNITLSEAAAKRILKDPSSSVIFSTVRHPYERLVSAYINKFEDKKVYIREGGQKFGLQFGRVTRFIRYWFRSQK